MTTDDELYCPTTAEHGSLVVDSTQIDVVEQALAQLQITVVKTDPVPAFDLALLTLAHNDMKGTPVADVGPVLGELRARFAGRCGGWTPFLGKNRNMGSQFGAYPQTQSMGYWDPQRVAQDASLFTGDAGRGVRVGLLDTKIYAHPHLEGHDVRTPDHEKFTEPDDGKQFTVEEGHGVFAAGLVLRQAPGATLVARHALDARGKATAWNVVKKLAEFLADEDRVSVLVLASGCRTHDGQAPLILRRAIERLSRHIMVVAAAGNHGEVAGMSPDVQITRNSATWPAALPGVVAVGVAGELYSPDLPWVSCTIDDKDPDVFVSTYLKACDVKLHEEFLEGDYPEGYARWRGTSCAAAVVGGRVAARMAAGGRTASEALADLRAAGTVADFTWQLA
ncbi:Subtilase family protein [Lentzea xinjiangensis]|uniref:Subtilase family protein n=1 Tax=Lentzea xinjiangensis TaxID=402600 RepID=A0A1H9WIZ7_9PSEU|nr:S8/S53 family peptidase [Lentzea xinjiangensis]SES33850.1 Subtilase family protein [Lentzea xinjiangensis]